MTLAGSQETPPLARTRELADIGFLRGLVERMGALHLQAYAASLAYGAVFALVPTLALMVLLLGAFNGVGLVERSMSELRGVLPADALAVVETQLTSVAETNSSGGYGIGAIVSAAVALYGASGAMRRIMEALNVVNGVEEDRSFVRKLVTSVVLAIGAVVVVVATLVIMVVGGDAARTVFDVIGLGDSAATVWAWMRWPLLVVLVWAGVAALYRYAPVQCRVGGFTTPGTLLATGSWIGFSVLFSWYVGGIGSVSATWGAVAGLVVFLLYLQYVALIVLLGALVDVQLGVRPGLVHRLRSRLRGRT